MRWMSRLSHVVTETFTECLLKSSVQEDEDAECEEERSLMEDTMDQSSVEEAGDENDEKIVIGKKMHQVGPRPLLLCHHVQLNKLS